MCIVECLCVCLCLFVCLSFFLCLFLSVCLSVFLFTWPTGPMLLLVSDCVCPATGAIAPLLGAPTSRTTGLGDIIHFWCLLFKLPFSICICITFNWSSRVWMPCSCLHLHSGHELTAACWCLAGHVLTVRCVIFSRHPAVPATSFPCKDDFLPRSNLFSGVTSIQRDKWRSQHF